jgi:hypothetical protein
MFFWANFLAGPTGQQARSDGQASYLLKQKEDGQDGLLLGHSLPYNSMIKNAGFQLVALNKQLPYHTILEIYSFLFQYSRDFNGPIDLENWVLFSR